MQSDLTARVLALAATARQLAADASGTRLGAAVQARYLSAETATAQLTTAVRATVLAAAAVVGRFLIFVEREDALGLTDTPRTALTKPLQDALTALDMAAKSLGRASTDGLRLSEIQYRSLAKIIADTAQFTESQYRDVSKSLTDTAALLDLCAAALSKPLSEVAHITEHKALTVQRTRDDGATLHETATRDVGLGRQAAAQVEDLVARQMSKSLLDFLAVTDDLDGQASLDDDQEMAFIKARSDLLSIAETFARTVAYLRTLAEAAVLSDQTQCDTHKARLESAQWTDHAYRSQAKPIEDIGVLFDAPAWSVQRLSADALTLASLTSIRPDKGRADQAAFSDAGSLRSQGYADFSYFSEDYVGASRAF
jgi:hypothetical protein